MSIISIIIFLQRRRRRLLNESYTGPSAQTGAVDKQDLFPSHIDPFPLKLASISIANSQVEQGFISDKKLPLAAMPAEEMAQISGNANSEPTVNSRNPSLDLDSEDVTRRPSSSAANSLTPSATTTTRQRRLQEQEQASVMQLASLEARIGSYEWVHVSRPEYDALIAEMGRLRAEVSWFKDVQQSDWALGLSDEMPPHICIQEWNTYNRTTLVYGRSELVRS
jgi:hypothetical protein